MLHNCGGKGSLGPLVPGASALKNRKKKKKIKTRLFPKRLKPEIMPRNPSPFCSVFLEHEAARWMALCLQASPCPLPTHIPRPASTLSGASMPQIPEEMKGESLPFLCWNLLLQVSVGAKGLQLPSQTYSFPRPDCRALLQPSTSLFPHVPDVSWRAFLSVSQSLVWHRLCAGPPCGMYLLGGREICGHMLRAYRCLRQLPLWLLLSPGSSQTHLYTLAWEVLWGFH